MNTRIHGPFVASGLAPDVKDNCSSLADELAKLRGKDNEALNSWTDRLNLVPELERRLEELDEQIGKLEIFKHRHIG